MDDFEYDEWKSRINGDKHGIDFEQAKALWLDPQLIEIAARSTDEPRYLVIGQIGKQHWSAVITYRHSKIRLISVRRARQIEIELYESARL